MPGPKPNKLHDELDALLDGRPVELTDELAPLVEAADALRAELASFQLDPEVADRHLERVLEGSATVVQMPVRHQPNGWDLRRRMVAVALAAALVLAPATMASAAALPGQAMYPFKLAIEQLRLASVQWSPAREAGERTRVADERLEEVESLYQLRMFTQLPTALDALKKAVIAAKAAVSEAAREGEPVPVVEANLSRVAALGGRVAQQLVEEAESGAVDIPAGTRQAIQQAVEESQDVLTPPGPAPSGASTPTPTTPATRPDPGPNPGPASTNGPAPTQPTQATNPPEPTTTDPSPTTTAPPPTTPPTTVPPTTTDTATPGSGGAPAGGAAGGYGPSPVEAPPTTSGATP
jgi:hypothetical protein